MILFVSAIVSFIGKGGWDTIFFDKFFLFVFSCLIGSVALIVLFQVYLLCIDFYITFIKKSKPYLESFKDSQFRKRIKESETVIPESVEDIAKKMKPVDENTLQLPHAFARKMRYILEDEKKNNKKTI